MPEPRSAEAQPQPGPPRPARAFSGRPIPARPARSRATAGSFWLWIAVAAALGILGIIPLVVDMVRADLVEIVARNYPQDAEPARGRAVIAVLITLSGAGLLLATLVTAFAIALRAGRRAARLALVALAVLTAPFATVAFQAVPPAAAAVPPLTAALAVGATAAMFLPASNAWFARR